MTTTPNPAPQDPVDSALAGVAIPSCPRTLTELQHELASDTPDIRKVTNSVSNDIALSVAVLRTVNSPIYALPKQVANIAQAVSMLGLRRLGVLVTNTLIRQALKFDGLNLDEFWSVSTKRAFWMTRLSKRVKGVDADTAHSVGLLCDLGVPLLMQKFSDYADTYKLANELNVGIPLLKRQFPMMAQIIGKGTDDETRRFTEIEFEKHGIEHAQIGAMMARTWGLSPVLCDAIRRHHDYTVFWDKNATPAVAQVVAMSLVAEFGIHRSTGGEATSEWEHGGESALGVIHWSIEDVEDWVQDMLSEDVTF